MTFNADFASTYLKEYGAIPSPLSNRVGNELATILVTYPHLMPVIFEVVNSKIKSPENLSTDECVQFAKSLAESDSYLAIQIGETIKKLNKGHRTLIPAFIWSRQGRPISFQTATQILERHKNGQIEYPKEAQEIAFPYCVVGKSVLELSPEVYALLYSNQLLQNPQNHFSHEFIRDNSNIDTHLLK